MYINPMDEFLGNESWRFSLKSLFFIRAVLHVYACNTDFYFENN